MFDQSVASLATELDTLSTQIDRLAAIPPSTASAAELGPLLVRLEHVQDRLAGIAAGWLGEFATAGGPEQHGAPSLNAWARRELRVTPAETVRRNKRATALAELPDTRAALSAGMIGVGHLDAIAHGVHQMGADTMAAVEPLLLDVAATCDPNFVRAAVRKVRDTLDPDAGLAAYLRALDRRDITLVQVGEGFAIHGFLDPENGIKLKELLYSLGKKTSIEDDRTPGQRRVDGLGDLCSTVLNNGLPSDRGHRPHLSVTVSADRLNAATQGKPASGEPAVLDGFGDISDQLLAKIACDSDTTPIATDDTGHVLDVGRTARLATTKQRKAILVQQDGVCFNPGCDRTHLEIHHLVPWSLGGNTNMADLRGYCTRCHHLIHLGLLLVTPDDNGDWHHETQHRQHLPQHKRKAVHLTRIYLQALTEAGKDHAIDVTQNYRRGRSPTLVRT